MSGLQERKPPNDVPTTIEGAIDHLIAQLPLKDKTRIAKMNRFDLSSIHRTMAPHIRDEFGLLKGNRGAAGILQKIERTRYDPYGCCACDDHRLIVGQAAANLLHESSKMKF